jgi:hypothetical protein
MVRLGKGRFKPVYTVDPTKDYAKDAHGTLLYSGANVRLGGIRTAIELNGKEGTCVHWDLENGRMHVRLNDGQVKAFRPLNLTKLVDKRPDDVEEDQNERIRDIFRKFDIDGDGIIDYEELHKLMETLGMNKKYFDAFRMSIDKDLDFQVQYDEFVDWALGKAQNSRKTKLEVYWPEKVDRAEVPPVEDDDSDVDEEAELTMADVERLCGKQAAAFPAHGLKLINNMHKKFPEYPIQGILYQMNRNDFIGGNVIVAIRKTKTVEVEVLAPTSLSVLPGAFPAVYKVKGDEEMPVYKKSGRSWAFQHLRDGRWPLAGSFPAESRLRVLEVKRSNEYGFCFGRVEFGGNDVDFWVNLGKELFNVGIESPVFKKDSDLDTSDLQYTEATRITP